MNKTTCIAILLLCLLSACSEKLVCPAYQSAFILDDNYRERYFSPFEVVAGDTVPRGGFNVQRKRTDLFVSRVWTRPERPVLENPYLLAKIFNKRPYWKLDIIKPVLVHYVSTDTLRLGTIPADSTELGEPLDYVVQIPDRIPPHNQEQFEYNKKFGHLFPRLPRQIDPNDSTQSLQEFMADTLATDSIPRKRFLGIFKRKNKPAKSKRKRNQEENQGNTQGTREEDNP